MKITFIKPNIGRRTHSLYIDHGRMEPLMLGLLAGMTPPDVEVVLYDDRMEEIPYDEATDLVAISVESFTARRAYEISGEYRQRGVQVILGGMHPTLIPDEAAAHADSIFLGDAENVWPQVVEDARRRKLKPVYKGPPGIGQIGGILPRRDLYRGKGYLPISLMQFSRGCKFTCKFCAVSQYFDKTHYIRPIDEVLQEIEAQDRKLIFFVDDNIASHREGLRELCHALIPMKISWVSQASLDVTQDEKLVRLMAQSGCLGNVTGFESITLASLKDAKKSPNLPGFSNYEREIRVLRDNGMQTWAAFTLGYDNDTYDSVMATLEFALKNRFTFAAFNILMPYPGTPLYRKLKEEGRLLFDGSWWLHPEYRFNDAAFVPTNMTPDQLTQVCDRARQQFNSIPSLLRRFADVKTNMRTLQRAAVYWRYASVFRNEVHRKHGMRFGLN
ncbi:MAG: B12-binding domain-containing radical SAM protein [Gammaproteobacteria bacterium]|nr:B12-binding domain-containing radical SAM protein [Gammaproteobacteria bacterium]